jgi:hypothetical protein
VSSVLLSTANSSVQAACELVGDLDLGSDGPSVGGELGLGVLLRLGGLLNLVLLVSLHINVVLDKVDSWRQSWRLCPRLQAWFLLASISLHECITK